MAKRIIWSENAVQDRLRILDYWYKRTGTKSYSEKLNTEFIQSIKKLSLYPKIGRRLEDTDIRFIVKYHYQIFYRYTVNEIRILHLWDSRRNPDDLIIEV